MTGDDIIWKHTPQPSLFTYRVYRHLACNAIHLPEHYHSKTVSGLPAHTLKNTEGNSGSKKAHVQQPINTYSSWISTPPTAFLLLTSTFLTARETSSTSPAGAEVPTIIPDEVSECFAPEPGDVVLEITDSSISATFGRPGVNESRGNTQSLAIPSRSEVARV